MGEATDDALEALDRAAQLKAADKLAAALASVAMPMAEATEEQPLDAATLDQMDIGLALMQFAALVPGFVERIVPGDVQPAHWENLANSLKALEAACRREHRKATAIDMPGDVGDSGGR